jgi:hypothetical protein
MALERLVVPEHVQVQLDRQHLVAAAGAEADRRRDEVDRRSRRRPRQSRTLTWAALSRLVRPGKSDGGGGLAGDGDGAAGGDELDGDDQGDAAPSASTADGGGVPCA